MRYHLPLLGALRWMHLEPGADEALREYDPRWLDEAICECGSSATHGLLRAVAASSGEEVLAVTPSTCFVYHVCR